MRDADLALYVAKSKGKVCFTHFAPGMHAAALQRLQFTSELRRGIDRGELVVHYQPIVDLADDSIAALEALVRWRHPTRGMLWPQEFIPLAEESGLILPLGLYVLEAAMKQAVDWDRRGLGGGALPVSVNLSGRQLQDPGIVADVRDVLDRTGADPALCMLEITESVLLADVDAMIARLESLRALGLRLLIDDFGTGYSSLSRLQQLPVDGLKAAREFVEPLTTSENASGLARSIRDLADAVGLRTVAEGVENEAQAAELRVLGYRYGQGYLFARPAAAKEIEPLLVGEVAGRRPAADFTRAQRAGLARAGDGAERPTGLIRTV
jgi:EAL domain-containing protein (putative c-di-GMP-specific phosphodiesterase class I)